MSTLDFLQKVRAEFGVTPLFIGTDLSETNLEGQENEHCLSLTAAQAQAATVDDLRQMLYQIIAAKSAQLHQLRGTVYPMQFYCWHDEQASQLRFSMVEAAAVLPFGCRFFLVADIAEIIQPFLDANSLDGIPWGKLETVQNDSSPDVEEVAYCLRVWRTVL